MIKPWRWLMRIDDVARWRRLYELFDGTGRERATIWERAGGLDGYFVWHTWDPSSGVGGENSSAPTLRQAKDECIAAIVRQGWAPGGWEVTWS